MVRSNNLIGVMWGPKRRNRSQQLERLERRQRGNNRSSAFVCDLITGNAFVLLLCEVRTQNSEEEDDWRRGRERVYSGLYRVHTVRLPQNSLQCDCVSELVPRAREWNFNWLTGLTARK
jgi:hypothetical protein